MTSRGEFDVIRSIAAAVPRGAEGVLTGIGDDCAVLATGGPLDLLLTTDLLLEGRHFAADASPEDVGWKALAVSVSDIAAMGGRPRHAVLAIALRPEQTGEYADRLLRGLLDCAARYGCALVGGDTNRTDGPLVVSLTLTGDVEHGRAVLRSGARDGDGVFVTGALGGSILGRHLRATPRVAEAAALVASGPISAMIDLSDGLSSDLQHVLEASGVGAEIWADRIPVHADAVALAERDGRSPVSHALNDGEDFELCFTAPIRRAAGLVAGGLAGTPVAHVGRIVAGRGAVLLEGADAPCSAFPLLPEGFDHFR